jgi:hypothetical protein
MDWHGTTVRLAAKHADQIRKGFQKAFNADDITASFFAAHLGQTDLTTQQARDWTSTHITPDKTALNASLKPLYADGWVLGQAIAQTLLIKQIDKSITVSPTISPVTDWANWKPGNRAASALLKPKGGLQNLLDRRGLIIDGVTNTKLDRIGTVLGRALELGLTPKDVSIMVDQVINDPQQALIIAQTEMSRAVSVASRDLYTDSGVEQVEWLVAEGCDDCQENADASPIGIDETFPSGDTEPPAHPNCMCALAPYVVDTSTLGEE